MKTYFTAQRNIQIVISLLKQNGIKRVVTSPGMTDVPINLSLQHDPYFELYSCVDERSAAYMACGMAGETGEPVALTCTGATASRNYMPGLTEASANPCYHMQPTKWENRALCQPGDGPHSPAKGCS